VARERARGQLVEVVVTDPSKPITAADVDLAKALLIARRAHALWTASSRRCAIADSGDHPSRCSPARRDRPVRRRLHFAIDLGLVRLTTDGGLDITYPILPRDHRP
jgi:hypothetical protein